MAGMSAAVDSRPPPKRRATPRKKTRQSATKPRARTPPPPEHHRWLWIIPLFSAGLLAMLAVLSFHAGDGAAWRHGRPTLNWIGPVGHGVAWTLFQGFGLSAYGVAFALLTVAILACTRNGFRFASLATFGWALVATTTSALAFLLADPKRFSYPPGGILGQAVGQAVKGAFSLAGSLIVLSALLLMAVLLATHFAAARAFELAARGVGHVSVTAARRAYAAIDRRRRARLMRTPVEDEDDYLEAGDDARVPVLTPDDDELPELPADEPKPIAAPKEPKALPPRIMLPAVPDDSLAPNPESAAATRKRRSKKASPSISGSDAESPTASGAQAAQPPIDSATDVVAPPVPLDGSGSPEEEQENEGQPAGSTTAQPLPLRVPAIIEPRPPPKPLPTDRPATEQKGDWRMRDGADGFHVPTVDEILEGETHSTRRIDRAALTATAAKLVQKLNDLGVQGEVTEIRPGPVVTMYELKPAAGIKLSRIASLGDDLAMAMEALRVRIVAPIPGKGVVGFEVPNKTREMVLLKEVVEQEVFQKSQSRLTMAVGKDIEGMPYVVDLAKMPHLLIAGTTGSGKSVAVNSMLVSMLMRATPEELRLIMVDPKMLELSSYEGIPHLLLPVVTDPKKAVLALRWGVEEMERRYELLAGAGVRNIAQYNKWVEKKLAETQQPRQPVQLDLVPEEGEPPTESAAEPDEPPKKLPYLVIVIDELADLMMVAGKEIEVSIARLAQMARASGLHLMVATQRPSTDVLTGVIKANFPSRISFQVASRHDSGTIINAAGAENLLGMGDMLILPPGTSTLTRVHGAYVSEPEIQRLMAFWKAQGAPVYDPDILKPRDEDGGELGEDEVADELYDQALMAVSEMRMISISLLQRKMRIGYNRAARMIERMERDGVVGPADGAKPREVLIHGIGEMPNV